MQDQFVEEESEKKSQMQWNGCLDEFLVCVEI